MERELSTDHLARFISMVIDDHDLSELESSYSEQGQNAYHPRMLLKILIYGYAMGMRFSRKLANSCRENIAFIWLTGRQTPGFRTIRDFRRDRVQDLQEVFVQELSCCQELGKVPCGKVSLDGTMMLANANRHRVKYRRRNKYSTIWKVLPKYSLLMLDMEIKPITKPEIKTNKDMSFLILFSDNLQSL